MKKTLIAAGLAALLSTTAMAETIGVSMALFDDNFLTVLRNGLQAQADALGLSVQIEDAQDDAFAVLRGQGGQTEVDPAAGESGGEAGILRQAAFGDICARHDLEPGKDGGRGDGRIGVHGHEKALDAHPDGKARGQRFDMDVGGTGGHPLGQGFGDEAEGFLRISFCASEENIKIGIQRMKEALNIEH